MKASAIEALCNAIIGLAVSWAVTFYALPLWGFTLSALNSWPVIIQR